MALMEKHLVVKKSTIPHSGKGLFTKVFIPKGKKIVEYKGVRTTWKDVKADDGKNGYIFYINRNSVIDAQPSKKELGRYANDARGIRRMEGITNNAEYIVEGDRCFIYSRKAIPAGAEILVGYGADYWKVIGQNKKLNRKKGKVKKKRKALERYEKLPKEREKARVADKKLRAKNVVKKKTRKDRRGIGSVQKHFRKRNLTVA